jgi:hypothetical protein
MATQQNRRVIWPRLAGVVVLLDGVIAGLAAGAFLLVSTIFRPVGAIQGQAPVEQSWLLEALVAAVLAIAGVWGGQRAIRGIHAGRLVGAAVAGFLALYLGWFVVTGGAGSLEATAGWTVIVAIHAAVALVLLTWRLPPEDRILPAAVGARSA